MYGEDFRYGIDNPDGAPEPAEVANVGNPISSAVHLKIKLKNYIYTSLPKHIFSIDLSQIIKFLKDTLLSKMHS